MSNSPVISDSCDCRAAAGREVMVCHCRRVTEAEVRAVIDAGEARCVGELTMRTGAGSNCRGCHCRLDRMLAGLPPDCGRFAPCGGCGCIQALCRCEAA